MLKNLQLTNFRGFEQLELKQLNRVNLIVGDNNTGKTSILEALLLMLGGPAELRELPNAFRARSLLATTAQDQYEGFWKWLHTNLRAKQSSVAGTGNDGSAETFFRPGRTILQGNAWCRTVEKSSISDAVERVLAPEKFDRSQAPEIVKFFGDSATVAENFEILIGECAVVPVGPSDPAENAEQFNLVSIRPSGEEDAEHHMRALEPRLRKLRYRKLPKTSAPMIYAELDGIAEFIPSSQLGQAFTRVLQIYCLLRRSDAKRALLVDEVENGIYFQNLFPFWNGVLNLLAADGKSQLFATTHSFECMKAAHLAACERADKNGGTYDLNIIRLDRVEWGVKATEFGREGMEAAIQQGWEMR